MKQIIKPALIIVVMVLLAVVIGGVIAFSLLSRASDKRAPMTTLEISKVITDVESSSDGTKHRVTMNLYFELSDDLLAKVSVAETRKALRGIISTMDYDRIIGGDSITYIRDIIISQLSDNLTDSDVGDVYVTDIVTGSLKFYSGVEEEEPTPKVLDVRNQQRFNALFGNE